METIKSLPADATWTEIKARIHLLAEVNMGCEELQRVEGTAINSESEFISFHNAGQG